ncbi:MAG: hypothetical protein RR842_05070 [Gordonibacter sp.]|uniref:hypothetical protein n=1 Tax=Gordonibacter sp. TaxID=1968902 RepID=UPI002FC67E5A
MRILGMSVPELLFAVPFLVAIGIAVFAVVMIMRLVKAAERTAAATEALANEVCRQGKMPGNGNQ